MQIVATLDQSHKYNLLLSGAPSKCVVEVRFQNTMNGVTAVDLIETDVLGNAHISTPNDFGQHTAVSARVLTEGNDVELHPFTYAFDSTPNRLRLVSSDTSVGSVPLSGESVINELADESEEEVTAQSSPSGG
jgi:hypothetical protein